MGNHSWFQSLEFFGFSTGCRGEVSDVLRTQPGSAQLRKEQLSGPNISVVGVFEFSGENLRTSSHSPRFPRTRKLAGWRAGRFDLDGHRHAECRSGRRFVFRRTRRR